MNTKDAVGSTVNRNTGILFDDQSLHWALGSDNLAKVDAVAMLEQAIKRHASNSC
ncbi:MAG TPA: hypothetical protein VGY55_25350 [Pirellulales bacterium]|nr:hypothetical protein [Pirellulales bacterium]